VDHSGWRGWRVPRSLCIKVLYCRFLKRVSALRPLQKTKVIVTITIYENVPFKNITLIFFIRLYFVQKTYMKRPTPPNERASPLRHLCTHRAAHMRLGPENLHHYLDVNVKVCASSLSPFMKTSLSKILHLFFSFVYILYKRLI
jgi:hypothetical protein